jgi:hypothetical protein
MTEDEAQRSRWTFYEVVIIIYYDFLSHTASSSFQRMPLLQASLVNTGDVSQ